MKRQATDDPGASLARRMNRQTALVSDQDDGGNTGSKKEPNKASLLCFLSEVASSQEESNCDQQSEATSSATTKPRRLDGKALSCPHPKNFAERLMNLLERGIASDAIWWDDDIKGVVLQPKRLKKGEVLKMHFSNKKYPAFLRSFNRWGFRRVTHHDVPNGAVIYKNCLFRLDEPHLVKHMRMDSDVQDVFERHQLATSSNSSRCDSPALPSAANTTNPVSYAPTTSSAPGLAAANDPANALQQMLTSWSSSRQQASQVHSSNELTSLLQGILNQPGSAPLQTTSPALAPASAQGEQSSLNAATKTSLSSPLQAMAPTSHSPNSAALQANNNSQFASTLALLVQHLQGQPQAQPAPATPESYRDTLLHRILETTNVYLQQPPSPAPQGAAIRTCLEMMRVLGQEELKRDDSGSRFY